MSPKLSKTVLLLSAFATCVGLTIGGVSPLAMGANIYYVDYENGSDNNDGSSRASAWKHLPGTVGQNGSGWVQLYDGDVLYVKGGTSNPVQVGINSTWYKGNAQYDSIRIIR